MKRESEVHGAAYVTAHLDWTTFSAGTLHSWSVAPDGSRTPQATAWLTATGQFVATAGSRTDTVTVGQYPAQRTRHLPLRR